MDYRIGFGEDAHALSPGRPLVLGGLDIPESPHGPVAHSDGDALLHALADALLSTLALGDIGQYFPPTEAEHKDISSSRILARVLELVEGRAPGFEIINVAAVVTLDKPKLESYRRPIQASVASLLAVPEERVAVGFKTSEGLATRHLQSRVTLLAQV